jgi:hypothetical protein
VGCQKLEKGNVEQDHRPKKARGRADKEGSARNLFAGAYCPSEVNA